MKDYIVLNEWPIPPLEWYIVDMYKEVLEEIGLSPNEAKIYEGLLDIGASSVPAISLHIGVHKRNVYDVMPKLLRKGLVYQIANVKEKLYAPLEPAKLSELIWEKEAKLKKILPDLTMQFERTATEEGVFVYKGVEGFKNYLRDILKEGEDVYFVGAKGGWFDADLQIYVQRFLKDAEKLGINYKHIFDAEVKTLAPDIIAKLGRPYKFFPKKYSTTGAIDIFGDRVVTFSGLTLKNIDDNVTLIVIQNKELADCYRTWFQFMWESLPEEK